MVKIELPPMKNIVSQSKPKDKTGQGQSDDDISEIMRKTDEAVGPLPHETGDMQAAMHIRIKNIKDGGKRSINTPSFPSVIWDELREWGADRGLINDKMILYHLIEEATDIVVPSYEDIHGRKPISGKQSQKN